MVDMENSAINPGEATHMPTVQQDNMARALVPQRKILFLGETFRADAQTWMSGLRQFGDFALVTWELKQGGKGLMRLLRFLEYLMAPWSIRRMVGREKPDMVIAERTTSYGLLAVLSGVRPVAVAQQGITDAWPPTSVIYPVKKWLQRFAYRKADLVHAWGEAMAETMRAEKADMSKVMIMPKGIDLEFFNFNAAKDRFSKRITAMVTRSLLPDYRHEVILRAFHLLKQRGIDCRLLVAGQGFLKPSLIALQQELGLQDEVRFLGRLNNIALPKYLNECNFYVSMPITEGVSASLFEAMACGCYPVVSDLPGNRAWIRPGENGALVPIDNYIALADALEQAWLREEHRVEVAHANRRFVEEQANYSVNMSIIAQAYHRLIGQYAGSTL